MPSPDVSPYIDLTLYDRDPQDVFNAGITDLQIKMPDWSPREGNTEVLLLESLALEAAELIFAVNRLPSSVVATWLQLYGVDVDYGAQPTADLLFELNGSAGYTIPANTSATLELGNGLDPVNFVTGDAVVVPPGQTSMVISATGDRYTADANGVNAGAILQLQDSIYFVDSVALNTQVSGGSDQEDDQTYFDRATQMLSRLTDTLVLPSHFTSYALGQANIYRATTLDMYDPTQDADNNGPVGNDPGHVTVAVYGENGPVAQADKDALLNAMDAISQANLVVHVIDPVVTSVDITATIHVLPTYDQNTVEANINTALAGYLGTSNWQWGNVVRRNELITLISDVDGVDYLDSLDSPASDVTLTGPANLATLGTVTISATQET